MRQHPAAPMSDEQIRERIASVAYWYHQIEIRPGIVTPGINNSADTLRQLDLAERYDGLRVLDIGARDGFFSYEFERRGAEVVAVDYIDPAQSGFAVASELMDSSVESFVCNVYDLEAERHGTFDVVLFLGLLYHLRDPLLALDRIWDVCRPGATLILETQLLDNALLVGPGQFRKLADIDPLLSDVSLMQFYPEDTLNGDPSNYWAPNAACTRGLLRAAGFEVTGEQVDGPRGIFHARQTENPIALYQRQLEKSIVAGATRAAPASDRASATAEPAADADVSLELALASARQHLDRSEAELTGAREYISSLEAEIERKEAHLVAALAALARAGETEHRDATPPPPVELKQRIRRAADDLRGR